MQRSCKSERGIIVAIWILVFPLIIGFLIIAIDLAHLMRWRVLLEKSAKAAVMAGMMYRTQQGWMNMYAGKLPPAQLDNRPFPNITSSSAISVASTSNAALKDLMRAVYQSNVRHNIKDPTEESYFSSPQLAEGDDVQPLNLRTDTLEMALSYQVPTIFAGRLAAIGIELGCTSVPDDPSRCLVSTPRPQVAHLGSINVALVLDVSGSMACSNTGGINGCSFDADGKPLDNGKPRIEDLRAAVLDFTRQFNPVQTNLTLVPFATSAHVAASLQLSLADHRERLTTDSLNEILVPSSNTNICDGLLTAAKQIYSYHRGRPTFTVLFTDGAPNAMRGGFHDAAGPVPAPLDAAAKEDLSIEGGNGCIVRPDKRITDQSNDWYLYLAEMEEVKAGADLQLHRVPAELVHASSQHPLTTFAFKRSNEAPNPGTPNHCVATQFDIPSSTPNQYSNKVCGTTPDLANKYAGLACLSTLDFRVTAAPPAGAGSPPPPGLTRYLPGVPLPTSTAADISNAEQLPYLCAVEVADMLREPGTTSTYGSPLYVIGLGTPASRNCGDPFQDSLDWNSRKDIFLERLAMDWENIDQSTHDFAYNTNRPSRTVLCGPRAGTTLEQGYKRQSQNPWPSQRPVNSGAFIGIEHSESLRDAFRNVGTQIALGMMK